MPSQAELLSGEPGSGRLPALLLPDVDAANQGANDTAAVIASTGAALADAALQQRLPAPGPLSLVAGEWELRAPDLRQLGALLAAAGLELVRVSSGNPHTRVAAAALGLAWEAPASPGPAPAAGGEGAGPSEPRPLTIHQGTLRSGDHLEAAGSVLVLGDVNPGARISASGHVLVWGQLRGVAHAGCQGDAAARIVALQLRPVQLRIADRVARGPAEAPPQGLAEQARLLEGAITIEPAQPGWPLAGCSSAPTAGALSGSPAPAGPADRPPP